MVKTALLTIKNLHVSLETTEILKGINLTINQGEIHAIMGPNGSGKSTLSLALMGHPNYKVTDGSITFDGQEIIKLPVDKRAQAGIFLAFQTPLEIEGVTLKEFLYHAYKTKYPLTPIKTFESRLIEALTLLDIKPDFIERSINVGFSGGEKKRAEILQLAILQPKLVILDEIDSGLDIDALKIVCNGINTVKQKNKDMAILIITHYPRILQYLTPNAVHVLQEGIIVESGDKELAEKLEAEGYSLR